MHPKKYPWSKINVKNTNKQMTFLSTSPFIAIHQIHLTLVLRYVYVTVF